jgi:hypothetical protein
MTKYEYTVKSPWWYTATPVLTSILAIWAGVAAFYRVTAHPAFHQFREQSAIGIGVVFVVLILVKFLLNSLSIRQYAAIHNASAATQKVFGETAYLFCATVVAFGIVLAGLFRSL